MKISVNSWTYSQMKPSPPLKLERLDELDLAKRPDLEKMDRCFYWRVYTTGIGAEEKYKFSETNNLIHNFKASPKAENRKSFKQAAMEQIANELIQVISKDSIYRDCTFFPVPPSKPLFHLEYDDRLIRTLKMLGHKKKIDIDIRPAVLQTEEFTSHEPADRKRPSLFELSKIYQFDEQLTHPAPKKIIIFDDVLTKGTHFKAMQQVLKKIYPAIPIIGLFVAQARNIKD